MGVSRPVESAVGMRLREEGGLMRIRIGSYKGLTAKELVERDPGYAEWFWRHADRASMELRLEVRAALAEFRLARLSYQYDREMQKAEATRRQRAEERAWGPSAEEINFEKVRADGLQRELAEACRMLAEKDRELEAVKELFKKLRADYARLVCPSDSSSTAGS
jgi:FMN phosphatase YigB (HAD superfamily)